jgi:SOS response associated peptidase (SRAP)
LCHGISRLLIRLPECFIRSQLPSGALWRSQQQAEPDGVHVDARQPLFPGNPPHQPVPSMCGRFHLTATADALAAWFQLITPPDWYPRYNIAPTQQIPVIRAQVGGGHRFEKMRWGLVPSWAKELKGPPLINAGAPAANLRPACHGSTSAPKTLSPLRCHFNCLQAGAEHRHPGSRYDCSRNDRHRFRSTGRQVPRDAAAAWRTTRRLRHFPRPA